MDGAVEDHSELFIAGQWRKPHSREVIPAFSANTERRLGSVPHADHTDVDAAVRAARDAFDDPSGWSHWDPADRAAALVRFADALDRRRPQLTRAVSDQNGMPIRLANITEAVLPPHLLRYYADMIADRETEQVRVSAASRRTLVRSLAIGVVAVIAPWNFPTIMAALKHAPALAAGCTVVLKPSPDTVLDAMQVAEAVREAGLPPGVFNIVPGGREVGAYLAGHPNVDKVAFTGSTAVGRQVGAVCGRLLRPVVLELGGKSPAVLLDDADLDLDRSGDRLATALFMNNGQTCFLSSRILAPKNRYAEVVDTVAQLATSLVVGDSLDPATHIGPLVSRRQRQHVEAYISKGREEGARLVVGGRRPPELGTGWFVEPTVFADVDNAGTIAREEIFGPVVTITPYTDQAEAIRLANDSDYGLAATVWSADPERALAVARQLNVGSVGINDYVPDPNAPTTMIKASGLGVKFGREALESYERYQAVYM